MRVLVQHTTAQPSDWTVLEVGKGRSDWRAMRRRPVPTGGEQLDNAPGWIMALNCQGITLDGYDHYAVEPVTDPAWGDGLRLTAWNDDEEDVPAGERDALVWELFEPGPALGGMVNTRQRRVIYAEGNAPAAKLGVHDRPFLAFNPPSAAITAHGIWTSDELFERHRQARSAVGWRGWITP